jgi:hypothetical protein
MRLRSYIHYFLLVGMSLGSLRAELFFDKAWSGRIPTFGEGASGNA